MTTADDRGDDRRDRVLARVEPSGEDRDQRVRGQPDREERQCRCDQVEVRLGDLAAPEQDLDHRLPDDHGQHGDRDHDVDEESERPGEQRRE